MKEIPALLNPAYFIIRKISEYKKQRRERLRAKITERELQELNQKMESLMNDLDNYSQPKARHRHEQCVICADAKATIQTYPCAHKVLCRRCLLTTVKSAVAQRQLPLRCIICKAKVLSLNQMTSQQSSSLSLSSLFSMPSSMSSHRSSKSSDSSSFNEDIRSCQHNYNQLVDPDAIVHLGKANSLRKQNQKRRSKRTSSTSSSCRELRHGQEKPTAKKMAQNTIKKSQTHPAIATEVLHKEKAVHRASQKKELNGATVRAEKQPIAKPRSKSMNSLGQHSDTSKLRSKTGKPTSATVPDSLNKLCSGNKDCQQKMQPHKNQTSLPPKSSFLMRTYTSIRNVTKLSPIHEAKLELIQHELSDNKNGLLEQMEPSSCRVKSKKCQNDAASWHSTVL